MRIACDVLASAPTDPHEVPHIEKLDFEPVTFSFQLFASGFRFQFLHLADQAIDGVGQLVRLGFNDFEFGRECVHRVGIDFKFWEWR